MLSTATFVLITAFAVIAAALVAVDSVDQGASQSSRQFQTFTGGLGFGSHIDLSRCPWLFDPRLAAASSPVIERIPDDPSGSQWHSLSIVPLPRCDVEFADSDPSKPGTSESGGQE
jgi:hypothetical protein